MDPFIKWAGSERRIADKIRAALPKGRRLIEPFLGSGAVFLTNGDRYGEFLLGDTNPDLVHLYHEVRRSPREFIENARGLFNEEGNTEEVYYRRRAQFNALPHGHRERSLLFLYLNRHGFNGLCRYNKRGDLNVSFGRSNGPYFPEAELYAFATAASRATIRVADFRVMMREAGPDDVVYCDPPYIPLSDTASFVEYAPEGFADQRDLTAEALAATRRGATVVLSNHDTPLARRLYRRAASISTLEVRRSVGAKSRGNVSELIAVFRPRSAGARARISVDARLAEAA